MKFIEQKLKGVFIVRTDAKKDDRGSFMRVFCQEEFRKQGLKHGVRQTNLSTNRKRGTLRGMHFQQSPHSEAKLVSVVSGRIYDVVIDLRRRSDTYGRWMACELSEQDPSFLYIPEGCAHGFQTLKEDTRVFYHMFAFFDPVYTAGVRYNDPRFGIRWPLPVAALSDKDQAYPDFKG